MLSRAKSRHGGRARSSRKGHPGVPLLSRRATSGRAGHEALLSSVRRRGSTAFSASNVAGMGLFPDREPLPGDHPEGPAKNRAIPGQKPEKNQSKTRGSVRSDPGLRAASTVASARASCGLNSVSTRSASIETPASSLLISPFDHAIARLVTRAESSQQRELVCHLRGIRRPVRSGPNPRSAGKTGTIAGTITGHAPHREPQLVRMCPG